MASPCPFNKEMVTLENLEELKKELLEIKEKKITKFVGMDKSGIDSAVLFEEIEDINTLFINNFSPESIEAIRISTTSGSVYDLINKYLSK